MFPNFTEYLTSEKLTLDDISAPFWPTITSFAIFLELLTMLKSLVSIVYVYVFPDVVLEPITDGAFSNISATLSSSYTPVFVLDTTNLASVKMVPSDDARPMSNALFVPSKLSFVVNSILILMLFKFPL